MNMKHYPSHPLRSKATIGDLLYIVGAVVVFGNIISILVFKTRFF